MGLYHLAVVPLVLRRMHRLLLVSVLARSFLAVLKQCAGLYVYDFMCAEEYNCLFATNGGFFGGRPIGCVGNYVVNGTVLQLQNNPATNVAFLRNGSAAFGYASDADLRSLANESLQLVSGKGWLVRRGVINWNNSQDLEHPSVFATEFAPRTALAQLRNGSMLLVVINGIELADVGVNLQEFSELLLGWGAWQAVNLDGGGSSDAVVNGRVVSKPTCSDTPHICERPIVSIACIMQTAAGASRRLRTGVGART